jgi:hypothetical protein
MEQWSTMRNPQKSDMIMRLSGWNYRQRFDGDVEGYWVRGKEKFTHEDRPDFCNDLNAMHEVEEWAKTNLGTIFTITYPAWLRRVNDDDCPEGRGGFKSYCATASQRAEAFYLTVRELNDEGE